MTDIIGLTHDGVLLTAILILVSLVKFVCVRSYASQLLENQQKQSGMGFWFAS